IGVYNNYSQIGAEPGGSFTGADFSIAPDNEPPDSAITSITDGATIPGLQAIAGLAGDNIGVNGLEAAMEDAATGLWWNAQEGQWVTSTTGPLFGDARAVLQGPPNDLNWTLRADAGDGALANLASNLVTGGNYKIYIRAR
ncbi:MAG: hypothetical protein COT18_01680, partial [Elusimicrobia bacterium CG08_land_8_20_14_0_20_59_10]